MGLKGKWAVWAPEDWRQNSFYICEIDRWESVEDKLVYILRTKKMIYWTPNGGFEISNSEDLQSDQYFVWEQDVFDTKEEAQRTLLIRILT